MTLIEAALCCLETADPATKVALTHASVARWGSGELDMADLVPPRTIGLPGRPVRPSLVLPRETPSRGLGSIEGAAIGALIVGLARAAAVHVWPPAELFSIYVVMAAILVFRPEGLFQRIQARKI